MNTTIFLNANSNDSTCEYYLTNYGDLSDNKADAEFFGGIKATIITDNFYPGSFEELEKSILDRLKAFNL